MKTYDSMDEMWIDVCDSVLADGVLLDSRAGNTKELIGWSGRLSDPTFCFLFNPVRKLSPSYAAGEFIWYMSMERSIDRIVAYAPQYARFANDGVAHGAYGDRFAGLSDPDWCSRIAQLDDPKGCTPLAYLVDILKADPNTRQAVLPLYRATDLMHAKAKDRGDIPCTLCLNFLLRDGKLNLICTMRSNDAWLGLPYDVFCFCHLQMVVANMLNVGLGFYQHQVSSMHLYEQHWTRSAEALHSEAFDVASMSYIPYNPHDVAHKISEMVKYEEWNRKNSCCTTHLDATGTPAQLGHQLCLMAATKFAPSRTAKRIINPLLRKFWEKHHAGD